MSSRPSDPRNTRPLSVSSTWKRNSTLQEYLTPKSSNATLGCCASRRHRNLGIGKYCHLPGARSGLAGATGVETYGYAYGLHRAPDRSAVILRAFKGHVVSDPLKFSLPSDSRSFHAYELSFAAPRGLS